jgi:hypothetical protein
MINTAEGQVSCQAIKLSYSQCTHRQNLKNGADFLKPFPYTNSQTSKFQPTNSRNCFQASVQFRDNNGDVGYHFKRSLDLVQFPYMTLIWAYHFLFRTT